MDVKGARLHYVVEGSGVPVLVVGSAVYYPRVFSRRLRASCRMAFMDVRHFSERDAPLGRDGISLGTYVEDIESVRAHLGLERAVVIGHSHHGNLALEYAKRYPGRVSHVVLIGSPPLDVASTGRAAEGYWRRHASEDRKALLEKNLAAMCPGGAEGATPAQAYVARYVAEGPKYWYDATYDASRLWRDVPIRMDIVEVFREFFSDGYELCWDPGVLKAPVLVAMGRYDYAVPYTLWDEVRSGLGNLTFHLFERSGHTPQLEEPEDFDRVLLEWLRSSAPASGPSSVLRPSSRPPAPGRVRRRTR